MCPCRFHHRQRDAELRAERGAVGAQSARLLKASFPTVQRTDIAALAAQGRHLGHPATKPLILQATLSLFDAASADRVTFSALARRLGKSRQAVGVFFAGGIRTLATLAVLADALGYEAFIVIRKRESDREAAS